MRAQEIYLKLIDELRGDVKHDLLLTAPAPTKLYAVLGLDERATTSFGEIEKCEALIIKKRRQLDEENEERRRGKEVVRPLDIDREDKDEGMKYFWDREKAELRRISEDSEFLGEKKKKKRASESINKLRREMEEFQQELREAQLNVPPPPAPHLYQVTRVMQFDRHSTGISVRGRLGMVMRQNLNGPVNGCRRTVKLNWRIWRL